jgi:hypothetical protein
MAGTPPKYMMQSKPVAQATADAGRNMSLPLDTQVALLRQRVEQLTADLAALRSQMETECVRQHWNGEVHFPAADHVKMSVQGNSLTLDHGGLTINCGARVNIYAGTIELSAGTMTNNMGMAKFSGVVQCDSLIANTVSAANYTPGAGNIW